ncbi:class I SAM-dependent methyltransferase [Saccharothrix deserti]|uniref:class I SAM-dependent methyltransferase n=1 Tax=Saccharothrix deserti TaxID=2593674 RepID=UPI00131BE4EE|nr:class I SAM-dependent methyltransferase [Saccharothrix deserti]
MVSDPKHIVESGYDAIATEHLDWIGRIDGDPRMRFLEALSTRLPASASVLELGCGAGVPCTAALAERHDVLGVDISAAQLDLARRLVPRARFLKQDMTTLRFPPDSFDAVTAFYSIGHIPRHEHAALFARITRWLRPGGLFLAALACGSSDGVQDDWLGAPMYFSSHDPATNRALLRQAGLTLLVDEQVTMREPEGPATFQWVIARPAPGVSSTF